MLETISTVELVFNFTDLRAKLMVERPCVNHEVGHAASVTLVLQDRTSPYHLGNGIKAALDEQQRAKAINSRLPLICFVNFDM